MDFAAVYRGNPNPVAMPLPIDHLDLVVRTQAPNMN
jgi:hypothetical protein